MSKPVKERTETDWLVELIRSSGAVSEETAALQAQALLASPHFFLNAAIEARVLFTGEPDAGVDPG